MYRGRVKRLKKQRQKQRVPTKEQTIMSVSHHLTGQALDFVSTQIMLSKVNPKGRRYTSTDKALALSLYHSSPKTYQLLRKIFALPSKSTLTQALQCVDIYPGCSVKFMEAFKLKVNSMNPEDRKCVLIFDEMSIKSAVKYDKRRDCIEGLEDLGPVLGNTKYVGDHALVFMVRGLRSKWKQPLGYFITSSTVKAQTLKMLLLDMIDKVIEVGLNPVVVLSDQGLNNMACYGELNNHSLLIMTIK